MDQNQLDEVFFSKKCVEKMQEHVPGKMKKISIRKNYTPKVRLPLPKRVGGPMKSVKGKGSYDRKKEKYGWKKEL